MFSRRDDDLSAPEDGLVLSDALLLERVTRGDAASFDALFYRHYDRVYGLLFRLVGERGEAEDLTQETFLKLHAHASSRPTSGQSVTTEENVSAWLYRVALNLGYNAVRGRRRFWQRNTLLLPEAELPVEGQVEQRALRAAVRAALARLPERQAKLLLLRQMGFSYAECAAVCEVAPGSVGTLLARAAEAFRRAYRATGSEEEK